MLAVLRSSVSLTFERVGYADPGMTRLKAEIGLPFKAHAGTWSNGRGNDTKNPYYTVPEYKFVVEGGGAVPQGPGLWDHVFSYARSAFSLFPSGLDSPSLGFVVWPQQKPRVVQPPSDQAGP